MTTCLGKELFIRFTASAFRKLLSVYVFSYFHFGFEGRMWDLIVSVPDHAYLFTLDMYCLGLRKNLRVLPKCNSCRSAIQWFYLQHCTSFFSVTKLAVYVSDFRVSKRNPLTI